MTYNFVFHVVGGGTGNKGKQTHACVGGGYPVLSPVSNAPFAVRFAGLRRTHSTNSPPVWKDRRV